MNTIFVQTLNNGDIHCGEDDTVAGAILPASRFTEPLAAERFAQLLHGSEASTTRDPSQDFGTLKAYTVNVRVGPRGSVVETHQPPAIPNARAALEEMSAIKNLATQAEDHALHQEEWDTDTLRNLISLQLDAAHRVINYIYYQNEVKESA